MRITDYTDKEIIDSVKEFDSISKMWDNSLSMYENNIAVKENDNVYTYKKLNEDVINFRGYLYEKGYRPKDKIRITSTCTYGFVKAFIASQTLGLCVTVLPEKVSEDSLLIEEYSRDCIGKYIDTYYPDKKDPAVIMFTGGTTGVPKGAVLSQDCVMVALRNACYGYKNVFTQKYLHVLPMHHVFGLIRSMLTCLYTGGTLILCNNPHELFDVAMKENPTISVLVPLLVERGVGLSQKYNKNFFGDSMETIITGAAPVAKKLAVSCKKLNINLCPGYGLTETACLVSGNPDMLSHPDSVGLLYPDQEVRFVDKELQIKGRNIMNGYVDSKENGFSDDGYFMTGDYGYLDDDGFLYILGRKKEMLLTSNGENVFPAQVESVFKSLSEVSECELFEAEDGTLHLEVFPNDVEKYQSSEQEEKLLNKLLDINKTLEKFKQASKIRLRYTDFPRTKSLKMIRRENKHG